MADQKPDTTAQAKEVAQKPAETTKKVETLAKAEPAKAVMALHRINGAIEPGTPFRPSNAQDLADLEALGAVRDLSEAEGLLFEKLEEKAPAADETLG